MRTSFRNALRVLDASFASAFLGMREEKGALLSFLFHGFFVNEAEKASGALDPQQGITVDMFRTLIRHFKQQSYTFVSPDQIVQGLDPAGKYVLITFDDGYYNNLRALPVLEEFDVPVVLFVSISHVRHSKSFWWDVVYRMLRKEGTTSRKIAKAQSDYKRFTTAEIEYRLRARYGPKVLSPQSDLDRPFEVPELRDFARHPLVVLGNHTEDHAILTNYSATEIRQQIHGGQEGIRELAGRRPNIISYPNGNCSEEIIEVAREVGLKLGVMTTAGKNYLPLAPNENMRLKRITVWGNVGIDRQCKMSRSDLSLSRFLSGIKAREESGHVTECS